MPASTRRRLVSGLAAVLLVGGGAAAVSTVTGPAEPVRAAATAFPSACATLTGEPLQDCRLDALDGGVPTPVPASPSSSAAAPQAEPSSEPTVVLPPPTVSATPSPTPTATPTGKQMLVGWSAVNIARAEKFAGIPDVTRGPFYGALPASYDPNAARFDPNAKTHLVSFSNVTSTLESYVKSVPDTAIVDLIYIHEVENGKSGTYNGDTKDYTNNGPGYVADYVKVYDRVKAANPKVRMGMVSASWAYRASQPNPAILQGSFLPPANKVDFYAVDTYQENTTNLQPLATHTKFQNWYKLVKGRGKPLGIAEYAHQFLTVVSQNPFVTKEKAAGESAARAKTITTDYAWLKSTGLFDFWLYWYYSHDRNGDPAADTREFTDQASIDAWAAVVADNTP
jgi:hypothetical protein